MQHRSRRSLAIFAVAAFVASCTFHSHPAAAVREAKAGCSAGIDEIGPATASAPNVSQHLSRAAHLDAERYGPVLNAWTRYRSLLLNKRNLDSASDRQMQRAFFRACDEILGRQLPG
jgi:hypothetical protein